MDTERSFRKRKDILVVVLGLSSLFFLLGPYQGPALGAGADYPSNPINIISGNPPGGFISVSAQIFADAAKKYLPKAQPINVQFKPGAATAVSADYVSKQPADGYNILWLSMSLVSKMAEEEGKLSFNKDDFYLVGTFVKTPFVMPYNLEKAKAKTFEEFIALAKKHPGDIPWGSTGFGSSGHVTYELLAMQTGIKLNQVPFKGAAEAMTALMGGHVETMFTTIPSVESQLRPGGGLGLYAVTSAKRFPQFPNVPTYQEKGITMDRYMWVAMALRKGTPPAILKILGDVLKRVEDDREVQTKMAGMGYMAANWGPEESRKRLEEEFDISKKIFKKTDK